MCAVSIEPSTYWSLSIELAAILPTSIEELTNCDALIVLFVKVCVATRDTKVESAPSGNNITFVTPAL